MIVPYIMTVFNSIILTSYIILTVLTSLSLTFILYPHLHSSITFLRGYPDPLMLCETVIRMEL